jgi:uncharacterized membrane protein YgaE (UPF0421/DUF939 family)
MRTRLSREALSSVQLAARAAISAAVAVAIAQWLGLNYPLYAMISAVIVTDPDAGQTRELASRRLTGTVIGAGLGAAAAPWLPPGPLSILIMISFTMLLCHPLRLNGAARISAYICGIVLLEYHADPWHYALDRLIETFIGIFVAYTVSMVPKLLRHPDGPSGDGS